MLSGPNGAGKTNILEAVSLLAPGRGLRRAPLSDMARSEGPGGFAVAARLGDDCEIGTGTQAAAPERRQVRINGAPASVNAMSERLSVLWLTPAMDRLFADSAGGRRRFLDRLVLALEPGHAHHSARYEAAMRARNKLLAEPDGADPQWLAALEAGMAEHGETLGEARARTVAALAEAIAAATGRELSQRVDFAHRLGRRAIWPPRSGPRAGAMPPPGGRPSARTARISTSSISPSASPPRSARPASRRRC